VEADVRAAISRSHLRELPSEVINGLLSDAIRMKIRAGSVTHREGEISPHLELVITGIVRVFVTAPDGRTMTVRYCRSGALIGAMSLFATDFAMPATTQALVDADLLKLSPTVVSRAVERDLRVARAFLSELSERARNFVYEIPGSVFATVRQRVARHLLDLASERAPEGALGHEVGKGFTVTVSQQELAEAVGTVREVIVRVLRELREEGVIQTKRDGIVIVDPALLTRDQGWNSSS
jgi:CRP/FNR family cyclic AMP-dependent transcriptional regulator